MHEFPGLSVGEVPRNLPLPDISAPREHRSAVFTFILMHDYQEIRKRLEQPETPAQAQAALSELQNLKARLIQEMEGRKESSHIVERNYFQELLRSIDLDIRGFTYRQENEIPDIATQREHILEAVYDGRFNLAEDWLETLWQQPDGRAQHLELTEELKIVEDIFDLDFDPGRSLLAGKISSNLDSIQFTDLQHLPQYIDKQRQLLALLERIRPLAESRGWMFEWSAMRNHVQRAVGEIHQRATDIVLEQLHPSIEELQEAKLIAEENLQELEEAEALLNEIEEQVDRHAEAEDLRQTISELQASLSEQYQELEILQVALGGEDLESIEFLEDDELDRLHLDIHAALKPLERLDRTLRSHISNAEHDIMRKVTQFLARRDDAAELRAQHAPIEAQVKFLHRKLDAVRQRRNNQDLLKHMHAIHALDVRPIRVIQ